MEREITLEQIGNDAAAAMRELLDKADLRPGALVVVGCSSSEIGGGRIGHDSSPALAEAAFNAIYTELRARELYLAAQCCEHLNRALIVERALAEKRGYEIVAVVPKPKAGGSFATAAWNGFTDPVAVERVQAEAGMDVGETLIGMHLRPVAVPARLQTARIGCARVTAATTRPKFIGGCRAQYE